MRVTKVTCDRKNKHGYQKNTSSKKTKNEVPHKIQSKCRTKSRFEVIVMSFARNEILTTQKIKRRPIIAPAIALRLLKTLGVPIKMSTPNKNESKSSP